MKKQRILKKALRIICVQQGITYDNVAHDLGLTKGQLLYSVDKVADKNHKKISEYIKDRLELEVTPKISCILNDMSFSEYCFKNDINYQDFIYERVV